MHLTGNALLIPKLSPGDAGVKDWLSRAFDTGGPGILRSICTNLDHRLLHQSRKV
jgi:hypothetical protein